MKKCPQCGRFYNDSWAICQKDNSKLIEALPDELPPRVDTKKPLPVRVKELSFALWCDLTAVFLYLIAKEGFFYTVGLAHNPYLYADALLWLLAGIAILLNLKKVFTPLFVFWILNIPLFAYLIYWSLIYWQFIYNDRPFWVATINMLICFTISVWGFFYGSYYLGSYYTGRRTAGKHKIL